MSKAPQQTKYWTFTWYKVEDTPEQLWHVFSNFGANYLVFQKEQCPTTGKAHYQAYVELDKKQRLTAMKKIDAQAHFEPRLGTQAQAREYCMKAETRTDGPWEFGEFVPCKKGQRSDLLEATEYLKTHNLVDTACEHPEVYVRYHRGLAALKHAMIQKEIWDNPQRPVPDIILLKGPPGTGKTRYIEENVRLPDPRNFYRKPVDDNNWFDGYMGQQNVLIDEFEGASNKYPLNLLLQILDRYDIQVPVKNGYAHFRPNKIYLTTNSHPMHWYDFTTRQDKYKALTRRFTKVIEFIEGETEPRVHETVEQLKSFF